MTRATWRLTPADRARILENRRNNPPRVLNEAQLIALRNAVNGSIFDAPNDSGFEYIKTFVEVASGVCPKFFRYFTEGLDQGSGDHP